MEFQPLIPELYVTDLEKTVDFYVNILGFKVEYRRFEPNFTLLSYQRSQIMFQELGPGEKEAEQLEYPFGRGINISIETNDVSQVSNALRNAEYPVEQEVKDNIYRENNNLHHDREIMAMDPDGYLLRFSQAIKIDELSGIN